MRCPTEKQISSFVDGELPESEAVAVRQHMELCSECGRALEAMVKLNEALDSLKPDVDAAALAQRVKTRIRDEKREAVFGFSLPLWARVSLVAAIVTIAVGLGNVAGSRMSELYSQNPQDVVMEQLAAVSNPGFASVVMDLGTKEIAQ